MRGCLVPVVTVLFSAVAVAGAQSSTTTASCSPIVNGGSSQITIRCGGVSDAQAKQLTTLMNRILAQHLDMSAVNARLDGLHSDMGHLQQQIGGLQSTFSPLANAPTEVRATAEEMNVTSSQCRNLALDWMHRQETLQETMRPALQGASTSPPDRNGASQARMQQYVAYKAGLESLQTTENAAYQQDVLTRMLKDRKIMLQVASEYGSGMDYRTAGTPTQVLAACGDFGQLLAAYQRKLGSELQRDKTISAPKH